MQTVTKLPDLSTVTPNTADIPGWTPVAGSPRMTTWVLHAASDGTTLAGYWECTPGTYHAAYGAAEFVHMIAGSVTITPEGGTAVTMTAGDAFVVDATFKGTWEVTEPVRKHFSFRLK
ncbi:MAG: cupin domain-containing protein [Paracoccaceae bacterium]